MDCTNFMWLFGTEVKTESSRGPASAQWQRGPDQANNIMREAHLIHTRSSVHGARSHRFMSETQRLIECFGMIRRIGRPRCCLEPLHAPVEDILAD